MWELGRTDPVDLAGKFPILRVPVGRLCRSHRVGQLLWSPATLLPRALGIRCPSEVARIRNDEPVTPPVRLDRRKRSRNAKEGEVFAVSSEKRPAKNPTSAGRRAESSASTEVTDPDCAWEVSWTTVSAVGHWEEYDIRSLPRRAGHRRGHPVPR